MQSYREARDLQASRVLQCSLVILAVLLILPDAVQDYLVNYVTTGITGGIVLGFTLLQAIEWWLLVLVLGVLIGIMFATFAYRWIRRWRASSVPKKGRGRGLFGIGKPRLKHQNAFKGISGMDTEDGDQAASVPDDQTRSLTRTLRILEEHGVNFQALEGLDTDAADRMFSDDDLVYDVLKAPPRVFMAPKGKASGFKSALAADKTMVLGIAAAPTVTTEEIAEEAARLTETVAWQSQRDDRPVTPSEITVTPVRGTEGAPILLGAVAPEPMPADSGAPSRPGTSSGSRPPRQQARSSAPAAAVRAAGEAVAPAPDASAE
jgi:hypothetical protein